MKKVLLTITILYLALAWACSTVEPTSTVTPANANPVIVNIEYTGDIFNGEETDLHCIASDGDGDPLTYIWTVEEGAIYGSGNRVSWLPPEELGTYPIKLTVRDSRGGETTETINIRVLTNADGTATTKVILKLKLGQSTEPVVVKNRIRSYFTTEIVCVVDNAVPDNLIYNWSAKGGKLKAEGLNEGKASRVGWIAPGVPGLCAVSVLVKDNQNNEAKGEVTFEVFCCGN